MQLSLIELKLLTMASFEKLVNDVEANSFTKFINIPNVRKLFLSGYNTFVEDYYNNAVYKIYEPSSFQYYYCLTMKTFKNLCENPQFNSHFECMKQNRLKNVKIPYDEQILNDFILTNRINEIDFYCYVYQHLRLNSVNGAYCMCQCAMQNDAEFAYTYFYELEQFQKYTPFIEYKQNYEQRKERLLMVREETYNNYSNNGNAIESVFSNEYLAIVISRFL